MTFTKTVRLGVLHEPWTTRGQNVHCTIKYVDGRLSITGVIGAKRNGDCTGSCGQINGDLFWSLAMSNARLDLAPGWGGLALRKFLLAWHDYHLNDMCAGSPAQRAELARHTPRYTYPKTHCDWALETLTAAGLQPDASYLHNGKPYSYGSAWLRREVPKDVLDMLQALPDADIPCPWGEA